MSDETFRNPKIVIESVMEIHLKHEKTMTDIKTALHEMNQTRDYLKRSNIFKPSSTFDQNSFGSLCLNEYLCDPFNSQILTGNLSFDLVKLCKFS
jgi:predicted component of viral defense system (DUF524 family)